MNIMERRSWLLAFLVLLGGCGGNSSSSVSNVQQGNTLIGYVTNIQSNSITSFSVDEITGALATLATAPTDDSPTQKAVSADHRFLYNGNLNGTIGTYSLDGKGGMQSTGSPIHLTDPNGQPYALIMSPSGQFLFAGSTSNSIEVFHADTSTGALQPLQGSLFRLNTKITQMVLTRAGKFLYAFGDGSDVIYCFSLDATSGALTQLSKSPVHTGLDPLNAVTDLADKFLFVTTNLGAKLLIYSIAVNGSIEETSTSKISLNNSGALSLNFSPDNKFLFVDVLFANDIEVFSFDSNTGSLTPVQGSPFHDGNIPSSVMPTPNGNFLVVARSNPGSLITYRIAPQTGAISVESSSSIVTGKTPNGVLLVTK